MISVPRRLRLFLLFGIVLLVLVSFGHIFREYLFLHKPKGPSPGPIPPTYTDPGVAKRFQICENQLTKCQLNKLRVVVINTGEAHSRVRQLIGSLHHHHKGEIKAVIYGLNLPPNRVNEVLLWEHVEYIDLEQEFVSAIRIDDKEKEHLNKDLWKPLVIKHSVDVFGKILYLEDGMLFQGPLNSSDILAKLETDGHYFAGDSCHSNPKIQGYVHGSKAYNDVLAPLVECGRRQCSKSELKLAPNPSQVYPCKDLPREIRIQGDDRKEMCYLIMREDFITSAVQLPSYAKKSWTISKEDRLKQNDNKIHIALGFPSTTKGNPNPSVQTTPVFSALVPSFLNTIEKKKDGKYKYTLYLAFDESDSFYNNPDNQKKIMDRFNELAEGYPASLVLVRCVDSNGWVTFLWNVAFQHAINDGADYFYQLNDDIRIETPGWSDHFVNALRGNSFKSDFGVTGPVDRNNQAILTQAFVPRSHYDIFGYLYPYIFKNWFSDDWMTVVYKHLNSNVRDKHAPMYVFNSQTFGTRYEVCDVTGRTDLAAALAVGKERLQLWLDENN